jgi:hypothetical protein
MNIYRVTYTLNLREEGRGGDLIESKKPTILVSAASFKKAILKTEARVRKCKYDFKPFSRKDRITGKVMNCRYTNFEIASCELVAESEI